jgi:hypothetical protein
MRLLGGAWRTGGGSHDGAPRHVVLVAASRTSVLAATFG